MVLPGGVSILPLVAVLTIGVGVILHIIGLATPEWSDTSFFSMGLWESCDLKINEGKICVTYSLEQTDPQWSSIRACEAFAILGMLASFLGLAMAAISVIFPMMGKPKNAMFSVISVAGCVASFIFILIVIIVWSAKVQTDPDADGKLKIGYSFILSIIGAILIGVGGVLSLVFNRRVA